MKLPIVTSVLIFVNIGLLIIDVMLSVGVYCGKKAQPTQRKDTWLHPRKYRHYIASLVVKKGNETPTHIFKCSTVIISKCWTLTTGYCLQCFSEFDAKSIVVISSPSYQWYRGNEHRVKSYFRQKEYSGKESSYNIGLIKVINPFPTMEDGFAIPPTKDFHYKVNSTAKSYSWSMGTTQEPLIWPRIQIANLVLFDQAYCQSLNDNQTEEVTTNMICAGNYKQDDQMCPVDSGGPLMQKGMVIGLLAWGARCNEIPTRGVYIRLSPFRDCIEHVLDEKKSNLNIRDVYC